MNVLHVNHNGSNAGGVEAYIASVSAALAKAGHSSRLLAVASHEAGRLMKGAVTVGGPDVSAVLAKIDREIEDYRPDAAYIHAVYSPTIVERISARLPTLAYVHGPYLVCPGYAQYLRTEGRVCPHTAGVACLLHAQTSKCCFGRNPVRHFRRLQEVTRFVNVYQRLTILVGSQYMGDLLCRNGIRRDAIPVLPPFLVENPPPDATPLEDHQTIAYVGRLTGDKGLPALLRALAGIDRPWRLIAAGDGAGRGECEKLAVDLGIREKVDFRGWLAEAELACLYRKSSFLIVPSLLPESFGRVGPEAATYGRATIAFDSGGVSDWLIDGLTGYLVPHGDVSALRAQIDALLASPSKQSELGRRAREMALTRWSESRHVTELLGHFQAVIG